MEISGAEIVVRCLAEEGVEFVFGYPGGAVLEIYDAIFKQNAFKHVLVRHEQAAAHAADAYSRSSKKVGVCLITSGPGATNAITGIATAYMDSIPMVVISGQVATPGIGLDAFQEVDMVGCSRPIVKHNFLVKDVRDLAVTIKKAFHIASTGRPGPVVIDIPKDITIHKAEFSYPASIAIRSYNPPTKGHPGQIKKAAQMIGEAKRPLIYVGGGAVQGNASAEVTELVKLLNAPCTNTLMGLGTLDGTDPNFLGMLGMHGTFEANLAMQYCDVLVAIGARFDDRVVSVPDQFLSQAKRIIHIDVDPSSIAKRVKVDVPIVGDVKHVLTDLIALLKETGIRPHAEALADWWKQVETWRAPKCLEYTQSAEKIKPQYVLQKLWEVTNGNAIVTSDVGQHQMWTAQYYKFRRPRQWINSGGLGTMGFGLPAAIGAQIANPEAQVACITGDGSIQMNIQELSTAKQYHTPIKIILLNNRYLGMVRQWQEFFYGNRYSETYLEALPNFEKLAEAYGHIGLRIEKPEDVEPALREAFTTHKDRCVLLNFITDEGENVFPMIQNGKGLNQMDLPAHMSGMQQTPFENNRDYGNLC
ncbi:MAG: biosynthetic-type acetolactate synthase large subunit [Formivibrio sp.]|nr:biosynthetic-type acetolactate synthase large subunit [Formivibrio sp.]